MALLPGLTKVRIRQNALTHITQSIRMREHDSLLKDRRAGKSCRKKILRISVSQSGKVTSSVTLEILQAAGRKTRNRFRKSTQGRNTYFDTTSNASRESINTSLKISI